MGARLACIQGSSLSEDAMAKAKTQSITNGQIGQICDRLTTKLRASCLPADAVQVVLSAPGSSAIDEMFAVLSTHVSQVGTPSQANLAELDWSRMLRLFSDGHPQTMVYRSMITKLRNNNNKPMSGSNLSTWGCDFSGINGALEHSGLPYRLRPVGERSDHYRFVRI